MNSWQALWREPRPAQVPPRDWRDWALVGLAWAVALGEAIWRPDLTYRAAETVVGLVMLTALLWRRQHPLRCVVVGFGLGMVLTTVQLVGGTPDLGLYTTVLVLVLLYALVRWGSGREIVLGLVFVVVAAAYAFVVPASTAPGDVVGGSAVLLAAAAAGAAFRYRADVWDRRLAGIRSEERVGLARELHDTVAHHVSAIAVQAQAGRAVSATRPEAAVETLATIEQEASRTLAEMRAMVQVLRHGAEADYAPPPGIADLPRLARPDSRPRVRVLVEGDAADLSEAVGSVVYRLAQESLTNALRHAHGAREVRIEVVVGDDVVRLLVADDGRADGVPGAGFGLVGMRERAALLGGSLTAGPAPEGGWVVRADLPRQESR